jgi:hypothetical protein
VGCPPTVQSLKQIKHSNPKEIIMNTTSKIIAAFIATVGFSVTSNAQAIEIRKAEPMVITGKRVAAVTEVRVAAPMVIVAKREVAATVAQVRVAEPMVIVARRDLTGLNAASARAIQAGA